MLLLIDQRVEADIERGDRTKRMFQHWKVNVYVFFLTDSIGPVCGLILLSGVPMPLKIEDVIRGCDVEAGPSSNRRQDAYPKARGGGEFLQKAEACFIWPTMRDSFRIPIDYSDL